MATKAMSEMSTAELYAARDYYLVMREREQSVETQPALILANQYDAELTRRREGKTI